MDREREREQGRHRGTKPEREGEIEWDGRRKKVKKINASLTESISTLHGTQSVSGGLELSVGVRRVGALEVLMRGFRAGSDPLCDGAIQPPHPPFPARSYSDTQNSCFSQDL